MWAWPSYDVIVEEKELRCIIEGRGVRNEVKMLEAWKTGVIA
jgi:hypothetical protein